MLKCTTGSEARTRAQTENTRPRHPAPRRLGKRRPRTGARNPGRAPAARRSRGRPCRANRQHGRPRCCKKQQQQQRAGGTRREGVAPTCTRGRRRGGRRKRGRRAGGGGRGGGGVSGRGGRQYRDGRAAGKVAHVYIRRRAKQFSFAVVWCCCLTFHRICFCLFAVLFYVCLACTVIRSLGRDNRREEVFRLKRTKNNTGRSIHLHQQ